MRAEGGGNGETRTYSSLLHLSVRRPLIILFVTGRLDFSVNVVSEEFQGKVSTVSNNTMAQTECLCLTYLSMVFIEHHAATPNDLCRPLRGVRRRASCTFLENQDSC